VKDTPANFFFLVLAFGWYACAGWKAEKCLPDSKNEHNKLSYAHKSDVDLVPLSNKKVTNNINLFAENRTKTYTLLPLLQNTQECHTELCANLCCANPSQHTLLQSCGWV